MCSVDFFSFTWQIPSSFFKIVCYLTNAVFVFITLGSVRPIFPSQEFVINSKPLLNIRSCISDQQSLCSSCSDTQLQWLFWEVPQWFLTCSCFEVSNTLTHLFRGVFNRVGGIFIAGMGNYSECSREPALFNAPLVHHT